uniref:C2H2-type domain-containing protein n=2 Tax=Cacopsylla melanoneura TaxID=428564 RepID=A0A8D8VMX9_9HEMI
MPIIHSFSQSRFVSTLFQPGSIRSTRRKSKHPQHNIHAMSRPTQITSEPAHSINTIPTSSYAIFNVQENSKPDNVLIEQGSLTNDTTSHPNEDYANPICARNEDTKSNLTKKPIKEEQTPRSHLSNGETFRQLSNLTKEIGRVKNPWLEEYIAKFKGFKQELNDEKNETDRASVTNSHTKQFLNDPSKDFILKRDCEKVSESIKPKHQAQIEADMDNDIVEEKYNVDEKDVKIKIKNEDDSNNNAFPDLIDRGADSTDKRIYSATRGQMENVVLNVTTDPRDNITDSMNVFVNMLNKFTSANLLQTNNPNREQIKLKNDEMLEGFLANEQSASSGQSIISKQGPVYPHKDYLHREEGKHSAPAGSRARAGAELGGKFQGGRSGAEAPKFPGSNSAYKCHKCGNSYARLHSLSRHVKFECGVAPKFECFICHKRSKHKHNLLLHMKTHTTHK